MTDRDQEIIEELRQNDLRWNKNKKKVKHFCKKYNLTVDEVLHLYGIMLKTNSDQDEEEIV